MRISKLALVTLLVLGATGCGKQAATQVRTPSATAAQPAAPVTAMSVPAASGVAPMTALADTGATTPAAPTDGGAALKDLTAEIASKKNGVLFGMGKFKCTVEVNNPNTVGRSGTLTVTFLNKGQPSKTAPEVRPLALKGGETRTYDFEDPRWTTDDVQIEVKTNPVAK